MSGQYKNQVRIIGGQWKRRLLHFPVQEGLRPTPDRVRETVFNWLGQDCTGMVCLDLFAGSGAMGFEAASRNASKVISLDLARPVIEALRYNQSVLRAQNLEIMQGNALQFLEKTPLQFDVIFVDPPFASDLLQQVLPRLLRVLKEGGCVYAECANWPKLAGWTLLREGRAGVVHYGLLQPEAPKTGL